MYDKESVYDNEIAPLMSQIIEICKREEIPMVASFLLRSLDENGDELRCTTALVGFEHTPDDFKRINAIAYQGEPPQAFAVTVTRQEERWNE